MGNQIKSLGAAVFLLFTALFFFSPYLHFQQLPFAGDSGGSDLTELNIPLRFLAAGQVQRGQVPLWSDMLSNGFPLLAEGQAGVFYPFNLLHYFIFPFLPGITLGLIAHYFLAALFTYFLARAYGSTRGGSLLAALSFGFGGALLFRITQVELLNAAVWLPLAIRWVEQMRTRPKRLTPLWLGITLAVQFFAGSPQISYLTVAVCMLYSAIRMGEKADNARVSWAAWCGRWALTGALALGVSALQILPAYELAQLSPRAPTPARAAATAVSFSPSHLLTVVYPFFFGNPAEGTYPLPATEGKFWQRSAYGGIFPLLFFLIGAVALVRRDRVVRAWLTVIVIGALVLFGVFSPYLSHLRRAFPSADFFPWYGNFLILTSLCLAVIAGKGWDWAGARLQNFARVRQWLVRAPFLRVVLPALVLVFTAADLYWIYSRYLGSIPASYFSTEPLSAAYLRSLPDGDRIYSVEWQRSWEAVARGIGGWRTDAGIFGYHREVLPPNLNVMAGIPSVDGRAGPEGGDAIPWHARLGKKALSLVSRDTSAHTVVFPEASLRLFGMQGARYFLSFFPLQGPDLALIREVTVPWMPPVKIYENPHALPRAFFVGKGVRVGSEEEALAVMAQEEFNPRREVAVIGGSAPAADGNEGDAAPVPVRVAAWDNGTVALAVDAPAAGYVVVRQTYYPGWQAWIDGAPSEVLRANAAFQALQVSRGNHTITLRFAPASFYWGRAITLITLAALIMILIWSEITSARSANIRSAARYLA